MRDERLPDDESADPTPLDRRLRAIDSGPVPDELLDRCLATIPDSDRRSVSRRTQSRAGWKARVMAAAAAVLLIGAIGLVARPRPRTPPTFSRPSNAAWTKVPASHSVMLIRGPGITGGKRPGSSATRAAARRSGTTMS